MLVLIFPGQGSQRAGMGAPWRGHPSWQLVPQLSEVVDRNIAELLLDTGGDALRATRNAQLATYALSLVVLDATLGGPLNHLKTRQPGDDALAAVAGHSLGEYTALVAAGALEAGVGARLVQARGRAAMQAAAEAKPGTMAAILGLDLAGVAEACEEAKEASGSANDNTPGQVVVAGTLTGIEEAGRAALRRGAKQSRLPAGWRRFPFPSDGTGPGIPGRGPCRREVHAVHLPGGGQRRLPTSLGRFRGAPVGSTVLTSALAGVAVDAGWHGGNAVRRARAGDRAIGHGTTHCPGRLESERRRTRGSRRSGGGSVQRRARLNRVVAR